MSQQQTLVFATLVLLWVGLDQADAKSSDEQAAAADALASTEAAARAPESQSTAGYQFLFSPETHLYPDSIADPRRANFGVQVLSFSESDIPDTGTRRYNIKFGGRFELFQAYPAERPDRGWQLGLEAGFIGQFDPSHSSDNIGWDGIYALIASFRPNDTLAYKFGFHHVSSHVGDEFAERTGRLRINYTRGEWLAGISWWVSDRWRAYGELGNAFDMRNDVLQEPWRAQAGLEYQLPGSLAGQSVNWYWALDLSATEERDWSTDATMQLGFAIRRGSRTWRVGAEYYDGRALLGEFFQSDERYLGIGLWLDL